MRPFIKASRERTLIGPTQLEPAFGAAALGPYDLDIPAGGFARYLWIEVTATGGVGASVFAADGPFNVLQNFTLMDVNGNILVGPFTGYQLYLLEKYGGYSFSSDAKRRQSYAALTASGNFSFTLRVPIEISGRDGYGSLPNQNSSQQFRAQFSVAPNTTVYTTVPPTTQPDLAIALGLEIWDQPPPTGPRGEQNEQFPPGLGTTQYWRPSSYNIPLGDYTQRLGRVGNNIRNLIAVYRVSGARSSVNFPGQIRFQVDDKAWDHSPKTRVVDRMNDLYGYTGALDGAGALDTGVFVWNFDHDLDGKPGFSNRHGLLETHEGTKLEILGTFGAAGVLEILTNDIATPPQADTFGKM
jgi:hypothetical protein